jgi:uncharacterized membrane protein YgcG
MTGIQLAGSNPGVKQLPVIFYPVGHRGKTAAEIAALVDSLNSYRDGFYMANELKCPGHKPTLDDFAPRLPVPADSDFGMMILACVPLGVDVADVETVATIVANEASTIDWLEFLGIADFWDLLPLWCELGAARTDNYFECLDVLTIEQNKCSIYYYVEDATSVAALAKNSSILMFFKNGVGAYNGSGQGTWYWGPVYTSYYNYMVPAGSEAVWNLKIDAAMNQMIGGRSYASWLGLHDILPVARTVSAFASPISGSPMGASYATHQGEAAIHGAAGEGSGGTGSSGGGSSSGGQGAGSGFRRGRNP